MTMHMEIRPIHSGRNIIELPKKTRHFSYKVYSIRIAYRQIIQTKTSFI